MSAGTTIIKFFSAVMAGNGQAVTQLLNQGVDVNTRNGGFTALQWASLRGRAAVAAVLLDAGAELEELSDCGRTALHCAAENGSLSVLKLLLNAGADATLKDSFRYTALRWAVCNGRAQAVLLLLCTSQSGGHCEMDGGTDGGDGGPTPTVGTQHHGLVPLWTVALDAAFRAGNNVASNEYLILQLLLWTAAARGFRLQEGGEEDGGKGDLISGVGRDGVRRVVEGARPRPRATAWARLAALFRSGAVKRRLESNSTGGGTPAASAGSGAGSGAAGSSSVTGSGAGSADSGGGAAAASMGMGTAGADMVGGVGAAATPAPAAGLHQWWDDIFLPRSSYPPAVIQDYFAAGREYERVVERAGSRNSATTTSTTGNSGNSSSSRNWHRRRVMASARVKLLAQGSSNKYY